VFYILEGCELKRGRWDKGLSPLKRMIYHAKYSLPIMYKIRRWGNRHLKHKTVEENSGLGKAIRYFDNHYKALTSFCWAEGAKRDNNEMEAQLKLKIRDRKNAMFYKTLHGASIADIVTSVIATVTKTNANVFDYFNVVQQEQGKVKANPQNYLPWNYTENR
jgi:transposase